MGKYLSYEQRDADPIFEALRKKGEKVPRWSEETQEWVNLHGWYKENSEGKILPFVRFQCGEERIVLPQIMGMPFYTS